MAKNISLLGADYPDVPAVLLPMTGGGTAMFVDPDELYDYLSLGTDTVANIETAMAALLSGTKNIINIRFQPSAASGPFTTTAYVGTFYAVVNSDGTKTRAYAQVFQGASMKMLIGRLSGGSWEWKTTTLQ